MHNGEGGLPAVRFIAESERDISGDDTQLLLPPEGDCPACVPSPFWIGDEYIYGINERRILHLYGNTGADVDFSLWLLYNLLYN